MIEQLISLISTFWSHILPFYVINAFEQAVVLRLGKFKKVVGPGLHWKIPFFDAIHDEVVVTDTMGTEPQALTTKDGKEIVVAAVVKYNIEDIKKYTLEITDEDSAISDICLGAIRSALTSKTWEECQDKKVDTYITTQARGEVAKYGVYIEKVRLTDLSKVRTFRIYGGGLMSLLFGIWITMSTAWDSQYGNLHSVFMNIEYKGFTGSISRNIDYYGTYNGFNISYDYVLLDF